ncbi:MAG: cytochrome c oxidase subunit II [Candidatus Saccharibacteria bacterium]|nr:cytochrome c oxidase subunit II [Pseudorhodobacter sp.]
MRLVISPLVTLRHGLAAVGLAGATMALTAGAAFAQALDRIGVPVPGATGFQPASSPTAVEAQWLDHMLNIIIIAITLFVTIMLLWVAFRFSAKRNPVPAKFTHNSPLEVAWTLVPIVILVFIGSFSLPALFFQEEIPTADVTIKVSGNQWYWSYDYPDAGVAFDSVLLDKADLEANGYKPSDYLLAADNAMVIPVNKTIVIQVTGADVIHGWAVPAFGVQHSAVPGRLGQLWFKAEKEGVYFGQCTALCGSNHAYMPIVVKVVSQEAYEAWLAGAKDGNYKLASN